MAISRRVKLDADGRAAADALSGQMARASCSGFCFTAIGLFQVRNFPILIQDFGRPVFAVGDVRSGNIKRIASAVGEGSIVVAFVHRVLHE